MRQNKKAAYCSELCLLWRFLPNELANSTVPGPTVHSRAASVSYACEWEGLLLVCVMPSQILMESKT